MKTSTRAVFGLFMVLGLASAATAANAQDSIYGSKPWLHALPSPMDKKIAFAARPAPATTASVSPQAYGSKPWLILPQKEFEIAVIAAPPERATTRVEKAPIASEISARSEKYSSKPWLYFNQ